MDLFMGLFISSPLTEQTSTTSRNWKKTNLDCTVLTYHSLTMPCDVLFDFLWSEQNKDAQRENLRKPAHIEKVVVWNPVNCVQCSSTHSWNEQKSSNITTYLESRAEMSSSRTYCTSILYVIHQTLNHIDVQYIYIFFLM